MARLPGSPVLKELLTTGRLTKYPKGQTLLTSDSAESFYLVKSGFIKRYLITPEGNLGIQVIYGPGDVFPITAVFKAIFEHDINKGPEEYFYETMSQAEVYVLEISVLLNAINKDTMLYRGLFRESGRRLESTLQGLENQSMKSSYQRVAHQLVFFAYQFGSQKNKKVKINIPLTHQDIASTLGLTRETVSATMSKLKKNGLVDYEKFIIVSDIEKLEALAHEL